MGKSTRRNKRTNLEAKIKDAKAELKDAKTDLKDAKTKLEKEEARLEKEEEKMQKEEERLEKEEKRLGKEEERLEKLKEPKDELNAREKLLGLSNLLNQMKMLKKQRRQYQLPALHQLKIVNEQMAAVLEKMAAVKEKQRVLDNLLNELAEIYDSSHSCNSSEIIRSLKNYIGSPSEFGQEPSKGYHEFIFLPRKANQICFNEGRVPVVIGSNSLFGFVSDYQTFLQNPVSFNWNEDQEAEFAAFFDEMKCYFLSEEDRVTNFIDWWNNIFGADSAVGQDTVFSNQSNSGYKIDIALNGSKVIFKVKNEEMNFNSEPFTEIVGCFIASLDEENPDSYEKILVTLVGTQIRVYGAVFSSYNGGFVICEPLLRPVDFCYDIDECRALIQALHRYNFQRDNISYPNHAVIDHKFFQWKWISNKDVCFYGDKCIKFSKSYSVDVHRAYSERNFAPKLIDAYQRGKWTVIVMEFLAGYEPLLIEDFMYSHSVIEKIIEKLKELRRFINESKYVHGDLRPPNILVNVNSNEVDIKIVDFAWAGEAEQVRYPSDINLSVFFLLEDSNCLPLQPICKHHDLLWLKHIISNLKRLKFFN